MANLFPIQKQLQYPIFGRFNALYGDTLVMNCPPLSRFQIDVLTVDEYKSAPGDLPVIDIDEEKDAFAYASDLEEDNVAFTKAGIVFNQGCIAFLGLTEKEQYAAIAHEIGHITYRFYDKKDLFPKGQGKEIYADRIAAEIGLSKELFSLIEKLDSCGLFADSESRFGIRKKYLKCMYIDNVDELF